MKKIEILKIESLSRAPLVIEGYLFEGSDPKAPSLAIVGAMDGDAILPLFCASQMVDFLNIVFDSILSSIFIVDKDLVIRSLNKSGSKMLERDEKIIKVRQIIKG